MYVKYYKTEMYFLWHKIKKILKQDITSRKETMRITQAFKCRNILAGLVSQNVRETFQSSSSCTHPISVSSRVWFSRIAYVQKFSHSCKFTLFHNACTTVGLYIGSQKKWITYRKDWAAQQQGTSDHSCMCPVYAHCSCNITGRHQMVLWKIIHQVLLYWTYKAVRPCSQNSF